MLEITPGNLRVLLHRARASLRATLEDRLTRGSVAVTCAEFVELVTEPATGALSSR